MGPSDHWPPAETTRHPPSQKYRKFWKSCKWKPFMWREEGRTVFPNSAGQRAAHDTPAQPGIYEFAISRTRTSNTKHTVYVGMSKNLRTRHKQYASSGSHIAAFIEEALEHGNVLWRRFRALDTELMAQQEEQRCQVVLDYPWNIDQNPARTRFVYTRKQGLFGSKVLVIRDKATGRETVKAV